MAFFHSLPQELLGHIYSFLPDRECQAAFYTSTKAVCTAPSVLQQISKLTVSSKALYALRENDPSSNPLFSFPRKAKLRTLEIEYAYTRTGEPPKLMAMLFPDSEEQRQRVIAVIQDVEELQMQACQHYGEEDCRRLGEFLGNFNLRSIKMPHSTFHPSFFRVLSAIGERKIKHLEMGEAGEEHDEALRSFKSLESLHYFPRGSRVRIDAISELHQLKSLHLDFLPLVDMVAALPASLETITFPVRLSDNNIGDRIGALTTVLSTATSGVLPALKQIFIPDFKMELLTHSGDIDADGAVTQSFTRLAQCISAASLKPAVGTLVFDCAHGHMHHLFGAVCTALVHNPITSKITICSQELTTADMAKIKELCPTLRGLCLETNGFDDLVVCLCTVMGLDGLEQLEINFPNRSFFSGLGYNLLTACALSPRKERFLRLRVDVKGPLTDAYGRINRRGAVHPGTGLQAMLTTWRAFCTRFAAEGARQPVSLEASVDGILCEEEEDEQGLSDLLLLEGLSD